MCFEFKVGITRDTIIIWANAFLEGWGVEGRGSDDIQKRRLNLRFLSQGLSVARAADIFQGRGGREGQKSKIEMTGEHWLWMVPNI